MATSEKTARAILALVFFVLGLWLVIFPAATSGPLPTSTILLQAFVSAILITLGLVTLFVGRIVRFANRKKKT